MNTELPQELDLDARFDAFVASTEPKAEPVADTPAQATPTEEPAAAGSPEAEHAEELFPGYSELPEDARTAIDAKIAAMLQVERDARAAAEAEAKRFRNQVEPIHKKLGQTEAELRKLRTKPAAPSAPSAKFEKMRSEMPDDAAAIEEGITARVSPLEQSIAELKAQQEKIATALAEKAAEDDYQRGVVELTKFDKDWQTKIETEDYAVFCKEIANTASPGYSRVKHDALKRAANSHDIDAAKFILGEFNTALAIVEAAMAQPKPTVRQPEPEPTTRKNVTPIKARRDVDEFDRRFNDFLAANPN